MELPESKGFFITGTDTSVGKTVITVALMEWMKQQGKSVIGMKPVAAGCEWQGERWVNEDALLLQQHSSVELPYETINPYAFKKPISPHLAAEADGELISIERLRRESQLLEQQADCLLVEGAGGWEVPLNRQERIADLAKAINYPVILVVGLRLGCINHALLSVAAIEQSGLKCAGWIANQVDTDMACLDENRETLQQNIEAPMLAFVPFSQSLVVRL
ncbi:MAG: dethiobiotin synthase [Gammaproteobacteria bacterium]|nr:MAG: dethiobiotin synthase [Gammaproteobacteria bacterium]